MKLKKGETNIWKSRSKENKQIELLKKKLQRKEDKNYRSQQRISILLISRKENKQI